MMCLCIYIYIYYVEEEAQGLTVCELVSVWIGIGNGFVEQKLFCRIDGGVRLFGRQKWLCVGRHFSHHHCIEWLYEGSIQVIQSTDFTLCTHNDYPPCNLCVYIPSPSLSSCSFLTWWWVCLCMCAVLSSCLSIYYDAVVTSIWWDWFGWEVGLGQKLVFRWLVYYIRTQLLLRCILVYISDCKYW